MMGTMGDLIELRPGQTRHHSASLQRAWEAIAEHALTRFRMAGFPRPFSGGERFNHLFFAPGAAGNDHPHLSLCQGLAVVRPNRLQRVYLPAVDCIACLDHFTALVRPS